MVVTTWRKDNGREMADDYRLIAPLPLQPRMGQFSEIQKDGGRIGIWNREPDWHDIEDFHIRKTTSRGYER